MSDIVERLRDLARDWGPDEPLVGDAFNEAADEIERLEADNARLRVALQEVVCSHDNIEKSAIVDAEANRTPSTAPHVRFIRSIDIARSALEGKDG